MKYFLPVIAVIALLSIGVAGIVLGEADDSPGLQGLGLLFVLGAVAVGVRTARRGRADARPAR